MTASKIEYDDVLRSLLDIAKRAGKVIVTARPPSSAAEAGTKNNSSDLVTETDKAVEKIISTTLKTKYPDYSFIGEETYQPGMKLGPEPTFICDPIDGTVNFVHGYAYVCVSLGFAVDKIPRVGVVFNPFTGVLYTGIQGEGSFKQRLELRDDDWVRAPVSPALGGAKKVRLPLREPAALQGLSGTVIALEWGNDRSGSNWQIKTKTWENLGRSKDEGGAIIHSGRSLGSAALNMCAVAEGNIDGYWEGGNWAWDVCAAWVILTETGGIIVDGNPGTWEVPVDHRKYFCLRGAPAGQKDLVEEFWSHVAGVMVYES